MQYCKKVHLYHDKMPVTCLDDTQEDDDEKCSEGHKGVSGNQSRKYAGEVASF